MEDFKMLPTVLRQRNIMPENWLDEIFNDSLPPSFSYKRNPGYHIHNPTVNIIESEKEYQIDLAAPGLNKQDFKISLDNNLLSVSANNENNDGMNLDGYLCHEFNYNKFNRSFSLPDNIDNSKIKALHKNGILSIMIPKSKMKDIVQKEIKID